MNRITPRQLSEMISAFVDGELNEGERQLVKRALEKDANARKLLEEFQRNRAMVASLPRHTAPASIFADVESHVERAALLDDPHGIPDARAFRLFKLLIPVAVAASLLFAAIGGWWYLDSQLPARLAEADAPGSPFADDLADETFRSEAFTRGVPRTVEDKLAAAAPMSELQSHPFEVEPLRLQVAVPTDATRDSLAASVTRQLAAANLADLSPRQRVALKSTDLAERGFFIRGRFGANFHAVDEDQILIRAPAEKVAALIGQLPESPGESATVALQAGPLTVEGRERSQQMLQVVAQAEAGSSAQSRSARSRSPGVRASRQRLAGDETARTATDATLFARDEAAEKSPPVQDADQQIPVDQKFLAELLKGVGIDPELFAISKDGAPAKTDADAHEPGTMVAQRRRVIQEPIIETKADVPVDSLKPADPFVTLVIEISSGAGLKDRQPTSRVRGARPTITTEPTEKPAQRGQL